MTMKIDLFICFNDDGPHWTRSAPQVCIQTHSNIRLSHEAQMLNCFSYARRRIHFHLTEQALAQHAAQPRQFLYA